MWDPATAYGLGLAATDGCLARKRTVAFGSSDRELVETFQACFGLAGARVEVLNAGRYFRTQLGDVGLYRFLETAGLTPHKSLTVGALHFPAVLFWHVVRGLLDGDGSIRNYVHNPIAASYPSYSYERLEVQFVSASLAHVRWLASELSRRSVRCALITDDTPSRQLRGPNAMYRIKLGKHAAIALLAHIYEDDSAPRLRRKFAIWDAFRRRYSDEAAARLVRKAGAAGRSYAAVSKTAGPKAHVGSNPTSGTDL